MQTHLREGRKMMMGKGEKEKEEKKKEEMEKKKTEKMKTAQKTRH